MFDYSLPPRYFLEGEYFSPLFSSFLSSSASSFFSRPSTMGTLHTMLLSALNSCFPVCFERDKRRKGDHPFCSRTPCQIWVYARSMFDISFIFFFPLYVSRGEARLRIINPLLDLLDWDNYLMTRETMLVSEKKKGMLSIFFSLEKTAIRHEGS